MKPSRSRPYDGAPAACVAASSRPSAVAASTELLPGSTQRMIRHSESTPSTSGTCAPPSGVASSSQRSPAASAVKKSSGACGSVFISAVVPSLRRSRVAVAMSPPATGAVATTDEPRSSSARRATSGCRVTGCAHPRAVDFPARRRGTARFVRPSRAPPRIRSAHRSTGPVRRRQVRRGRRSETPSPARPAPPTSARFWASIVRTRSASSLPDHCCARCRVASYPARGQGRRCAPVHRVADVPAAGAGAADRRLGRRGRRRPPGPTARRRPSASGRCCRGRPPRPGRNRAAGPAEAPPQASWASPNSKPTIQVTIVITIAPPTAFQKPST